MNKTADLTYNRFIRRFWNGTYAQDRKAGSNGETEMERLRRQAKKAHKDCMNVCGRTIRRLRKHVPSHKLSPSRYEQPDVPSRALCPQRVVAAKRAEPESD